MFMDDVVRILCSSAAALAGWWLIEVRKGTFSSKHTVTVSLGCGSDGSNREIPRQIDSYRLIMMIGAIIDRELL